MRRKLSVWVWGNAIGLSAAFALVALCSCFALLSSPLYAQSDAKSLADTWQGTLNVDKGLRTVLKISQENDGYKATFYSIDQGGDGIPVSKITLDGSSVAMTITPIDGKYEGKLSPDGKTITGTWSQGPKPLPLNFERATPETEWTIPPPTPRLAPMDPKATPSFEVATLKPSKPDEQGRPITSLGDGGFTSSWRVAG